MAREITNLVSCILDVVKSKVVDKLTGDSPHEKNDIDYFV